MKRARLSDTGEPSLLSTATSSGTSSRSNQGMQSSSNGVIFQNGTGPVANGDVVLANGCGGEELAGGDAAFAVRKRKQRQLSSMDTDVIRLIGQHLREMGFQ